MISHLSTDNVSWPPRPGPAGTSTKRIPREKESYCRSRDRAGASLGSVAGRVVIVAVVMVLARGEAWAGLAGVTEVGETRELIFHRTLVDRPVVIPAEDAPRLGTSDFSLATWVLCDESGDRLSGDLLSQYEPGTRTGFHLTLKNNVGVTSNQANWRHLQFGIDADRPWEWEDCGRPGNALFAFALAVHEGRIYAGTCEPGEAESGRVYRYEGGSRWADCGSPDGANSVTALAVYQGRLHAATGRYRAAGSSLPESKNLTPGGRIFAYEGGSRWSLVGSLPDTEAIGGLVVFRGRLHASSLYKPAGFFGHEEGSRWRSLPVPRRAEGPTATPVRHRVEAMTVHDGFLYASSYDDGRVWRFDGNDWTDCGRLGDNTQTYSFVTYEGKLLVGTWPSGRVYRMERADGGWTDIGRLGEELEVMGMMVHNGRLLAGSLPLARVYQYEGNDDWRLLRQLDTTPDVKYRRAWTMAEQGGRVFCSTLPSGRIHAFSAGRQTTWDWTLSSSWHHVTAVKDLAELSLYLDGRKVAETSLPDAGHYRLDSAAPLRLAHGVNGPLHGQLSDLRIYRRALGGTEIRALAAARR